MDNLKKIVLLNWYLDETIDFVLGDNRNKQFIEKSSREDSKEVIDSIDLVEIKSIQDLIKYINKSDISDLKTYSKHTHVHQGSLNPEILIVNDYPNSEEEDRLDKILTDDCEKLLVKMLAAININFEKTSIINTFFWRTPGDRKPTKSELDLTEPFFQKIIALLAPKYIISLGDLALNMLMGGDVNLVDSRGSTLTHENTDTPIFPLFHPRILIKQPSLKRLAWEDLKIIANEIS